jgi:hypothetical protein
MDVLQLTIILVGSVITAFGGLVTKKLFRALSEQAKRDKLFEKSTMSLLEYSISHIHRHAVEAGFIDKYLLRTMLSLHRSYKGLGGNGFVDDVVERAHSLHLKDVDESKVYEVERNLEKGEK